MATTTLETPEVESIKREKLAVIDTDIHNTIGKPQETWPRYLSKQWYEYFKMNGLRGRQGQNYPRGTPYAARDDAWTPSGGRPGSDLGFMQEQLLDAYDMEYGILNCLVPVGNLLNLQFGAALASAVNDWQIAEWLEPEPRLRASLIVQYEDPDLAVAEIERLGDHPGFVQVLFLTRTMEPMGRRKYWKMYEAILKHNLNLSIHFGGDSIGPVTGAGKVSHYIEDHAGMAQAFQAQVASFVYEGVFEHFPELKVSLVEGGFSWIAPLMWRLDSAYKKLKTQAPYLTRLPSEYIREHVWFSTQPMEEPPNENYFHQMLEHMDMNDKIMFATDYPHWDFDSPDQAVPNSLDRDLRRNIMAENARAFFGF